MEKVDGKKYPRSFGKSFVVKKTDDLGSEDFAMAVTHGLSLRYVFAESIFNTSQRIRYQSKAVPRMYVCIHDDNRILGREGQLLRIFRQDCSSNLVNFSTSWAGKLEETGTFDKPVHVIRLITQ